MNYIILLLYLIILGFEQNEMSIIAFIMMLIVIFGINPFFEYQFLFKSYVGQLNRSKIVSMIVHRTNYFTLFSSFSKNKEKIQKELFKNDKV